MESIAAILIALAFNVACVYLAYVMAERKGRSRRAWMWWAAFLGPLPLPVLALLPRADHAQAA